MDPESVLYFSKLTIMLIFQLSVPILGAAAGVGLIIALFQTLIQLQEQTLSFACKLAVIIVVIVFFGDWMASEMMNFQDLILDKIGGK